MDRCRTKLLAGITTLALACALPICGAFADNVPNRVFEMRTYTVAQADAGKLHTLFEDYSGRFFIKYGIQVIALWTPHDNDDQRGTLVCLTAHSSKQKAISAWEAFERDPKWRQMVADSGIDPHLLESTTSDFFDPTHYSPLK